MKLFTRSMARLIVAGIIAITLATVAWAGCRAIMDAIPPHDAATDSYQATY